jgi:hypothetical protein
VLFGQQAGKHGALFRVGLDQEQAFEALDVLKMGVMI